MGFNLIYLAGEWRFLAAKAVNLGTLSLSQCSTNATPQMPPRSPSTANHTNTFPPGQSPRSSAQNHHWEHSQGSLLLWFACHHCYLTQGLAIPVPWLSARMLNSVLPADREIPSYPQMFCVNKASRKTGHFSQKRQNEIYSECFGVVFKLLHLKKGILSLCS